MKHGPFLLNPFSSGIENKALRVYLCTLISNDLAYRKPPGWKLISAAFLIATNIKFQLKFESDENLVPTSRRFLEIVKLKYYQYMYCFRYKRMLNGVLTLRIGLEFWKTTFLLKLAIKVK